MPGSAVNKISTRISMLSSWSRYTGGSRENSANSFNDQPFFCTAQLSLARNDWRSKSECNDRIPHCALLARMYIMHQSSVRVAAAYLVLSHLLVSRQCNAALRERARDVSPRAQAGVRPSDALHFIAQIAFSFRSGMDCTFFSIKWTCIAMLTTGITLPQTQSILHRRAPSRCVEGPASQW